MADLTVTIPDNKLQLIKDWVQSRMSPETYAGWTDADYANYVEIYLASRLRAEVLAFQRGEYMNSFVFDDPIA